MARCGTPTQATTARTERRPRLGLLVGNPRLTMQWHELRFYARLGCDTIHPGKLRHLLLNPLAKRRGRVDRHSHSNGEQLMEPKITFLQLKEYMRDVISGKHKATKCNYLIEPQKNSFYQWEDFNTSNPTLMRVKGKTLLGYRAGGTDTCYVISPNGDISWGSELGIAILDDKGANVTQRFPLPIFRSQRRIDFPKTISQYKEVVEATPNEDIAYHDFRLINFDAYVYIYYHNGKIADFLDFIVKMPEDVFLSKIKDCEKLIARNQVTTEKWFSIWADSEWENAGIDGKRNFYGGRLPKNNISIYKLKNGDIHCTHRPAPDNAILNLGKNTSIDTTEDGIPKLGTLETCVRADCFDNSHLGSNGTETLATILGQEVLICVTHGVHNIAFSNSANPDRNLCYLPFFRVKDYETGEVLHWSREPIMLIDDQWSEYTFYGNWVASLDEFCYTSFPGGQLPEIEGKNTEDDLFYCPIGIGDTATGRLSFKPKDLLSQSVMENIRDYKYFNQ